MMSPLLDFWFDFASTYSYPAAMQIAPVAQQAGVMVRFRPFLLGPLFKAQGWPTSPFNVYPAKGRYMWRDLERICFDFDLPFRQPEPFPQNSLLAARVALIGLSDSWGEEFCRGRFPGPIRGRSSDRRSDRNQRYTLTASHRIGASVRSRAGRSEQSRIAHANGRGEAPRHLWRSEFHDSGR